MVTKKRGLGRGLDVLLGQTETTGGTVNREGELRQLPVEFIRPGKFQPMYFGGLNFSSAPFPVWDHTLAAKKL